MDESWYEIRIGDAMVGACHWKCGTQQVVSFSFHSEKIDASAEIWKLWFIIINVKCLGMGEKRGWLDGANFIV